MCNLFWTIVFEIVNDEYNVFRCDVEEGLLKASTNMVMKSEQLINVYFKAR